MLLAGAVTLSSAGKDINISGKVTDPSLMVIPGASVSFSINNSIFSAKTEADGSYRIRISGIYPFSPAEMETGQAFPNPFTYSVNIPVITGAGGDILFAVYDLSGRKVFEVKFPSVSAGSYRIKWDGCNQSGSPQRLGLYIYAIFFHGKTYSGRLLKSSGVKGFSGSTYIEPFMSPPANIDPSVKTIKIPTIGVAKKEGFHDTRLTDFILINDTIADFILKPNQEQPFKTLTDFIAVKEGNEYNALILKGINLGSSPPGYFPGEIAYAITASMYERWIKMMGESGFNSVRVYTLHPPVFYEKLAEYNIRHSEHPLYLFQGIWLDEIEDPKSGKEYDLMQRKESFQAGIREVVDCVHGKNSIPFRMGKAYGDYITDISPWVAGFIIGREISPQEVDSTNKFHNDISSWNGNFFSIAGASASEVFVTQMLNEAANYEMTNYSNKRTVSLSSWPTLDPLVHPTEIYTDEDKASIDITKISENNGASMLFASYHAYPYYPDFINNEPLYRTFTDEKGPDSYLGYLTSLKEHYNNVPLIIAEFGVPSSWGNAHASFSGMGHGGLSETQQGESDIRLLKNIVYAGCGGGFMFSWMDEWFKPTWIVSYLEAFGKTEADNIIPTRQLWHNLASPEQNFGLIGFDNADPPDWVNYSLRSDNSTISSIKASNDNSLFYLDITLSDLPQDGDTILVAFDTYLSGRGESVLPDGTITGNRAEFVLSAIKGMDSTSLFVTEAYNMNGLTPRFNLTKPEQKFRSTITNGAPWKLMKWITSEFEGTIFNIGRMPAGNSREFSAGEREAVIWYDNHLIIRIPWTMLYYYDPTQMSVIDGAVSSDGGYSFKITEKVSEGIAITVVDKNELTETTSRYSWATWLTTPSTKERTKKSLDIISSGLQNIPGFAY